MRTEFDAASIEEVGMPIANLLGIDPTGLPVEISLTSTRSSVDAVWTTGDWATVRGKPWAVADVGPTTSMGAKPAGGRFYLKARVTNGSQRIILTSPNQVTFY